MTAQAAAEVSNLAAEILRGDARAAARGMSLVENGAALRAHDLDELHYRLRHFLAVPEHLTAMRARAAEIGRPRSAFDVARSILGRLTPLAADGRIT